MNGKLVSGIYEEDSANGELLNPFVHHLELETTYDKIKVSFIKLFITNASIQMHMN